jgi:hypothetical protein
MAKQFYFSLLFVLATIKIFGQVTDTTKINSLMVYGENFMFSVKEPDGWIGDIDNARQYYSNIIFYKSKEDLNKGGALIQVYNFNKQDEKTEKDLEYDIKSYKKDYSELKQQDLAVSHKEYKCYSKTIYVENDFYQYIVYVNPGTNFKSGISVSMNTSKRPATEDELKAFKEIIASLIMFKG